MFGSLYKSSAHISITSSTGIHVNRLFTSYEHMKNVSFSRFLELMKSANLNESLRQYLKYLSSTGCKIIFKQFATGDCGEPIVDKTGRNGLPSLWILGSPYNLGLRQPTGYKQGLFQCVPGTHLCSPNTNLCSNLCSNFFLLIFS